EAVRGERAFVDETLASMTPEQAQAILDAPEGKSPAAVAKAQEVLDAGAKAPEAAPAAETPAPPAEAPPPVAAEPGSKSPLKSPNPPRENYLAPLSRYTDRLFHE